MRTKLALIVVCILGLSGCASGPTLGELRANVRSATFVQQGKEPARLGFGVVDTASWWAANGDAVGSQTGGWIWSTIAQGSRDEELKRAPTVAEIMTYLFDKHPIANEAIPGIMPALAHAWGVPYAPEQLRVVAPDGVKEDEHGYLSGMEADTDLVLVARMPMLQLTEKITMGAAFRAGFSFGTHTKEVTAESMLAFRAYRREPETGRYKNVWDRFCLMNNMQMETAYPFPEVVVSREKAKTLWDEATPRLISLCSGVLQHWAREKAS
jgi:hypothetical protein